MFRRLTCPSGSQLLEPPASRELMRPVGFEPVSWLETMASAAGELLAADFDAGLPAALHGLRAGMRMDRVYVVRYDHALIAGFFVAESCAPGVETAKARFRAAPHGDADLEPVWRSLLAGDVYRSQPTETEGGSSSLLVPIVVDGSFWGALGFDAGGESSAWPAQALAILQSAAACVAAALGRQAIERARLDAERARTDEAHEMNRLMAGVVHASRALLESPSFEEGQQRWLEYLARAVDADHARLGRFPSCDGDGSAAVSTHVWDKSGRLPDTEKIIPDTSDFRAWAQRLAAGETIWAHRDELTDTASIEFWREGDCYTDLIVPIVLEQRTVGWLSFDWASRREWKQSYHILLRTAADGAAEAIRRNEVARALLAERESRAADLTRANQAMRRAIAGLASLGELDVFLADMLRESITAVGAVGGAVELLDAIDSEPRIALGKDGELSREAAAQLGWAADEPHALAQ